MTHEELEEAVPLYAAGALERTERQALEALRGRRPGTDRTPGTGSPPAFRLCLVPYITQGISIRRRHFAVRIESDPAAARAESENHGGAHSDRHR